MVAAVKYEVFTEDMANGVHNWTSDTFKVYLSNAAPSASLDAVKADFAEIAAGNGYTAGGNATTITVSRSGGTTKIVGTDPATWTAAGGTIGPFQYASLYNESTTAKADPLVQYWAYATPITLGIGETFKVDLDPTNGIYTLT